MIQQHQGDVFEFKKKKKHWQNAGETNLNACIHFSAHARCTSRTAYVFMCICDKNPTLESFISSLAASLSHSPNEWMERKSKEAEGEREHAM